ncbi:MAG: nucleotide exchange factor GrpE [Bacteroidales bacterium]|jgi:molecular chaperone GrpE|nr:nucleotide exchange factor GrpE [Bacteroidales bacterium]MBQ2197226.1 nucleotide exchange factor GrpE [Bacteroidales bacterium]
MSKKKNIENQAKVQPEEKAEEKIAENAPSKKEEKKLKEAEEKIDNLTKEIQELKESVNKEKNDYLRLMADFENFRRHSAEAKLELVSTASAETIKGLLPVLDDCERAIKMLTEADDTAAKEGTELIYNKLLGYLKTKGLEQIDAQGAKFDTDFHEAVAQFPVQEEDKKGLVFDVVQKGYTLSGKVIRYAKVVVGI